MLILYQTLFHYYRLSPYDSEVKNAPAAQERQVPFLGCGDPLAGNGSVLQYSC